MQRLTARIQKTTRYVTLLADYATIMSKERELKLAYNRLRYQNSGYRFLFQMPKQCCSNPSVCQLLHPECLPARGAFGFNPLPEPKSVSDVYQPAKPACFSALLKCFSPMSSY